jgi:hypothetical protein
MCSENNRRILCTCGKPAFTYLKGAWYCIHCLKAKADVFWPGEALDPAPSRPML